MASERNKAVTSPKLQEATGGNRLPRRVCIIFALVHTAIVPLFPFNEICTAPFLPFFWVIVDFPITVFLFADIVRVTATQANLLLLIIGGTQWGVLGWLVGLLFSKRSTESRRSGERMPRLASQHDKLKWWSPWPLVVALTAIAICAWSVSRIQKLGRVSAEHARESLYESAVEAYEYGAYFDSMSKCDKYLARWQNGSGADKVRALRGQAESAALAKKSRE